MAAGHSFLEQAYLDTKTKMVQIDALGDLGARRVSSDVCKAHELSKTRASCQATARDPTLTVGSLFSRQANSSRHGGATSQEEVNGQRPTFAS